MKARPLLTRIDGRVVLLAALLASLAFHVGAGLWPVTLADVAPPLQPLAATITTMPPPPLPAMVPPLPTKPKRKPPRAVVPTPPVIATPLSPEPTQVAAADAPVHDDAAALSTPPLDAGPATPPAAPDPPEPAVPPSAPVLAAVKNLPPRIDLVYRGFLGTRGFYVGDAVYRLEHSANEYTISTIGEARGLAALFFRGQGKITSRGWITPEGLQPTVYSIERTSNNHAERATFDWQSGVVTLKDDQALPLEAPTYDPMAMMWQFYFSPPEQEVVQFNVATTRKLYRYSFRRVGVEKVTLPFGEVEAHVWRRERGDGSEGNMEATVWLAPSLHYVAAKMRLSNDRGTVEALLDSIRVDDTVAQQ